MNTFLKQISAQAVETATEDQAGDHTAQSNLQRHDFDLDVTEAPPTGDQLRTLLEYIGEQKAGTLVEGAKDAKDAMAKLKASAAAFRAPVVSKGCKLSMKLKCVVSDCRLECRQSR